MAQTGEPELSIELAEARISSALADPAVRLWVKSALENARDHDPVDVAADAALVARLLGDRADAVLSRLTES